MDFRLTDEQQHLRDAARKFAQAELPALAKELEEKNEPVPADMMARYAALGYLGINLPEQYGGHGLSHLDAVILLEALAKASPPVPFPVFDASFAPILAIAPFS